MAEGLGYHSTLMLYKHEYAVANIVLGIVEWKRIRITSGSLEVSVIYTHKNKLLLQAFQIMNTATKPSACPAQ